MQLGGNLYPRLLNLMEEIERSLFKSAKCDDIVRETILISKQFCLNHNVSFDFLLSDSLSNQEKNAQLNKIFILVAKLKADDDKRIKANEDMSLYR